MKAKLRGDTIICCTCNHRMFVYRQANHECYVRCVNGDCAEAGTRFVLPEVEVELVPEAPGERSDA